MSAAARSGDGDSSDGFLYEAVPEDEDWTLSGGEEDWEATVRATRARARTRTDTHRAEAEDDFVRQFLLQEGLTETLRCFQTEWAERLHKGLLCAERVGLVPSVYTDNQRLERELAAARGERDELRRAAAAAAEALMRLRRGRELHRREQQRAGRERNRVLEEVRRVQEQRGACEAEVKRLTEKQQAAEPPQRNRTSSSSQ